MTRQVPECAFTVGEISKEQVLTPALRLVFNGSTPRSSLMQAPHHLFQFYGKTKFRCAHQIKCPLCVPELLSGPRWKDRAGGTISGWARARPPTDRPEWCPHAALPAAGWVSPKTVSLVISEMCGSKPRNQISLEILGFCSVLFVKGQHKLHMF